MDGILKLVSVFSGLFRIIGNAIKRASVKRILIKLESRADYRLSKTEEMYFTVGKVITPEYEKVFKLFKSELPLIKNGKFEVKGIFDIDMDSFLVFVLCNDQNVTFNGSDENRLANFVKLYYFRVNKVAKQSKVEMCTHTFEDLNEKNLLLDFYMEIEKRLKYYIAA